MLSLAKELVTDPQLLLVDEPSAGLAPAASPSRSTRGSWRRAPRA